MALNSHDVSNLSHMDGAGLESVKLTPGRDGGNSGIYRHGKGWMPLDVEHDDSINCNGYCNLYSYCIF